MAQVTYTQADDSSAPGTITVNGIDKPALSGPHNNGRLDSVGDLVFAEFDNVESHKFVRVECIRTAEETMTIRLVFSDVGLAYYYDARERAVENVPITFQ
jgi:hypothetical protein